MKTQLTYLGFGDEFLDTTPKTQSIKKTEHMLDCKKLKTSALWNILVREWIIKPQAGKNICKVHIWKNYNQNIQRILKTIRKNNTVDS